MRKLGYSLYRTETTAAMLAAAQDDATDQDETDRPED